MSDIKKSYSRQYRWALRQKDLGNCMICGKASDSYRCKSCLKVQSLCHSSLRDKVKKFLNRRCLALNV